MSPQQKAQIAARLARVAAERAEARKVVHISLKRTGKCKVCDEPSYAPLALYCAGCWQHGEAEKTHKLVNAAVKRGELKPAKECKCMDCGKPARDYDHRDYTKPLEVEPVCRSCNLRRGPAMVKQKAHG